MNSVLETTAHRNPAETQTPPLRNSIILAIFSVSLGALACIATALWQTRVSKPFPETKPNSEFPPSQTTTPENSSVPSRSAADPGLQVSATPETSLPLFHPEPSAETRQLVTQLLRWDSFGTSTDQAAAWKQNLQELVKQGPAAIPAIQEFLAKYTDYSFGAAGVEALGYRSARTALIDALAQIGGPEAVAALATVLRTTADPQEIAMLAQDLEKLEPAEHRQEAVEAARQTLAILGTRKNEAGDVAPLFEVLQKFGGSEVAADLQKVASQWNYYATIALAQLPSGAGIPSLLQLAQDPNAGAPVRDASLQMLAQLSDQSADARAALLELAGSNAISRFTWRMVAPVLAGDQVNLLSSAFDSPHLPPEVNGLRTTSTSDNQHFFALPAILTAEQANRRLTLIDELLSATNDPFARQALQESKLALSKRAL